MMYEEIDAKTFENHLKQVDQKYLNKERSYRTKICYIDKDSKSGFALTVDGALCHVFSVVKGRGSVAIHTAIRLGANRLSCFGPELMEYYKRFGFHLSLVEKKPDGIDKNWMCLKHKCGVPCS